MNIQELKLEKISDTLSVYQKENVFSYGTDAVLLANYVKNCVKNLQGKHMCDLCTGTGIIPLLLCDYDKTIICDAVEINSDACEISEMSAKHSGYSDRFNIHNADIKNIKEEFEAESFDFLTCNPPYMTAGAGLQNPDDTLAIARHEIRTDLKAVISAAASILKFGGHLFMVHRADRLCDIISFMREKNIEPKRIIFVQPSPEKEPKLILTEGIYGAKPSLKIEPPIYVNI